MVVLGDGGWGMETMGWVDAEIVTLGFFKESRPFQAWQPIVRPHVTLSLTATRLLGAQQKTKETADKEHTALCSRPLLRSP